LAQTRGSKVLLARVCAATGLGADSPTMSDPVLGTPHHTNSNFVTTQSPVMVVAYLSVSIATAAHLCHTLYICHLCSRPSPASQARGLHAEQRTNVPRDPARRRRRRSTRASRSSPATVSRTARPSRSSCCAQTRWERAVQGASLVACRPLQVLTASSSRTLPGWPRPARSARSSGKIWTCRGSAPARAQSSSRATVPPGEMLELPRASFSSRWHSSQARARSTRSTTVRPLLVAISLPLIDCQAYSSHWGIDNQ
jgi:hypothetical protein